MPEAGKVRRVVPETIQTSGMDCGPAALRSLLAGFGRPISYGGLREACRTDVDGTSIDALEVTARGLGLDCSQLMLPVDHVVNANLPALLVVLLPSGMPHFVVGWRRHGRWVQVMDPASGRQVLRADALERRLYVHTQPVPDSAWQAYSQGQPFLDALTRRLRQCGLTAAEAELRLSRTDPALLDAATRALTPGRRATTRLDALIADPDALPEEVWFARPSPDVGPDGQPTVLLRGAVLLRARGLADDPPDPASLAPDLRAALESPPSRPVRQLLAAAGALPWTLLGALVALVGILPVVETAVLRGALDGQEPTHAVMAALALAVGLLATEGVLALRLLKAGRSVEAGLYERLQHRLPLLPDRYLRSRPSSDLAGRAHQLRELRTLPLLLGQAATTVAEIVALTTALVVLHPPAAAPAVLASVAVVLGAAVVQAPLREREQRHVEHAAALAQLELDGVLAVHPVRSLGGADALIHEHQVRLTSWRSAAMAAGRTRTLAAGLQGGLGAIFAVILVVVTLPQIERPATQLLVVLWVLGISLAGERLSLLAQQWPSQRVLALRLAEPLEAPTEPGAGAVPAVVGPPVHLSLTGVGVVAAGRPVLQEIELELLPGEHVAVVGASGSGKSTLLALLLGLQHTSTGTVFVDGVPLDRSTAERLWPVTAWVDPQVRVWNSSMHDNVGSAHAVAAADLAAVDARTGPEQLGDDGGLLSGGESQRVRLARAFAQEGVRLVVLDEALRGLDRGQRTRLLASARRHWTGATLICATHDMREAEGFDRVLVLEGGRLVEDGAPATLREPGTRFAEMLAAELELRADLDDGSSWRRLHVANGSVAEVDGYLPGPPDPLPVSDSHVPDAPAPATRSGPAPHRTGQAAWLLAAYVVVQVARVLAFLGSWIVVGRAITAGDVTGERLLPWALLLGLAAALAAAGTWLEGHVATEASWILRRRLLRGALGVDPEHVRRQGAGRLLGTITEVEPVTALAATGGLQAIIAAVELLGAVFVLLSVPVGQPLALLLVTLLVALTLLARAHMQRLRDETQLRLRRTGRLLERLAGQRTSRVQGGGPSEEDGSGGYRQAGDAVDRTTALISVGTARAWQVLALAGLGIEITVSSPSGTHVATALGGVLLAATALRRLGVAGLGLATAAVALRGLSPFLHPAPPIPAAEVPAPGLSLETVGLRVRRGDTDVLDEVSFVLRSGERVLLTGASGSGKSTLVEALAGLRRLEAGERRGQIALAPQFCDDHVLLAPLAFNVLLARAWPATETDVQMAWEVCVELGLQPLLERMPAGLAQVVGETGWQLSHGERALVGLARALLSRPDVLVLDESLGPLDPRTAQRALAVARRRVRTLVVVTQE